MPARKPVAKQIVSNRTIVKDSRFNLLHALGVAIVGLLVSAIGTGIVGIITIYVNQARLTDQVQRTSADLAEHLKHSVDKDEYVRRDQEFQHLIEKMATKEELRDVRRSLDSQSQMIRDVQTALSTPSRRTTR